MSKSKENPVRIPSPQALTELITQSRTDFVNGSYRRLADIIIKRNEIRELRESDDPDKAKRLVQLFSDWPRFNVGDIVWAMSSCPAGGSIEREETEDDDGGEDNLQHNILIDMNTKKHSYAEQSHDIGLTVARLSSSETKTRYLCMDGEDSYPYTVLISTDEDDKVHLCLTSYDKEEDVLWAADNIEEFSMLSEAMKPDQDGKDSAGSGSYVFTCYNKLLNVAFTEVVNDLKEAKLSFGAPELKEPTVELLDGCYYHIKSLDEPLTKLQKHFLVDYNPTKLIAQTFSDEEISKMVTLFESVKVKKD